ncbi:MAG: signal peptidase II [Candidatus Methanosuratincola sp.]|jgi:signal peptidase II
MGKYRLTLIVMATVTALDLFTKHLIRASLPLYDKVAVFPFLNIVHYQNKGAAFGLWSATPDGLRTLIFVAVLVAATLVILYYLRRAPQSNVLLTSALAMILGGAVGNSIERMQRGYVTDFLDFHWFGNPRLHWAAFNIADAAITIGVIVVIVDTLRRGGKS